MEVGPRELAEGRVTLVRRDVQDKRPVDLAAVPGEVAAALAEAQRELLDQARRRREERTVRVANLAEAVDVASSGFAVLPWAALGAEGESQLAEQGVSVRCLQREDGSLAEEEDESGLLAVVARAY